MSKSKILVVGGTGYIGKRIVKASLAQGHPTFVLMRPEIGYEIEKLQTLLSFKQQGARLVEGSFFDHQSLVDAVKEVDVVICTMSGVQFRSHNILESIIYFGVFLFIANEPIYTSRKTGKSRAGSKAMWESWKEEEAVHVLERNLLSCAGK